MAHQSRRQFLGQSLGFAAAGFAIGGTKSSGRVIGANDTIRIGIAGINDRGGAHVAEFAKLKNVEITYLIDPDPRTFDKRTKQLAKLVPGAAPRTIKDVREALDDKNLDAISIATPNHWHALMTIWGCQAGKDVYVEKPCSHNVHEGRVAVEAARKYGRIVQHGTQGRSSGEWAAVAELVKSGRYGKLLATRGLCYKSRPSIGVKPDAAVPAGLDYNLWTGPASEHPFNANYVPYNWHWFWDFGNGDIGNQGVHQMDIARWMISGATLPRSVVSLGGRFGYRDQGQTPNTQVAVFDYGDAQLIFEVRGLKTDGYRGQKVGNLVHLEAGTIAEGKPFTFTPKDGGPAEPLPKAGAGQDHFANFIAAVRSRKASDLNAEILEGHYSATLCHLANDSYRSGGDTTFAASTRPFGEGTLGDDAFGRMRDHLSRENGLALDNNSYRLGKKLNLDAKSETFLDEPEANKLLTRPYRKPFAVPDSIG